MKSSQILIILLAAVSLTLPACIEQEKKPEAEQQKVIVTSPVVKDVPFTQQYVCQIHSKQHINVCALQSGFLKEIHINEGQEVEKGYLMFKIVPVLFQAKLDAELAEAKLADLELNYTKKLAKEKVVSPNEVLLYQAKLAKAQAKAKLAEAELQFTNVKAPFSGIVDRQHQQLGSLIKEGEVLTTLSDNSVMWVYFNVPEARYLDYMAGGEDEKQSEKVELKLANGTIFKYPGKITTIEANFNNETGNIPFRADFPNPDRLLRHGQTGNVLIHRTIKDVVVIPQRATFEILNKRYVYIVDQDDVAHQQEITIRHEEPDVFVLAGGLSASDRIVYEGIRQVEDGKKVPEYEYRDPSKILANQKNPAE